MFINELMKEDAMDRLIRMLEHMLENYDKMTKDLHVSFIKYMENLWEKIYVSMMNQWHKILQGLEPAFIELAHYVESIVYGVAKEFLGISHRKTSRYISI